MTMLGLTSKTCSTAGWCLHIPRQHPRALYSRRGRLTTKAVGWVGAGSETHERSSAPAAAQTKFIAQDASSAMLPLQDPEGILAQPRGGHIQRRTLQKQIAEDKELQAQVDKKEMEMREELQRKRDVSMLCPAMRAVMWLLMERLLELV